MVDYAGWIHPTDRPDLTNTRLSAALADRYRIERELGQGGMATVYLAQDLKHDRKVALKVLKPELAAVLGAERFVVEIKTTAALQHPHILPLFDSGTADGFLYCVMPFIDGETLRGKLDRETQLGIDESVRIATDVASALHYAHQHGVIHRDIKPENILLHDGRPMVADFGIALAVSAAAGGRMTETGLSLGTPHYMSPEQATAEKELTARADIYSLGSVLYEMLTGNPPHTGASAQQIIMKIITETPQPVTALRRSVPANVAAATAKALEKLPADRFASAREFGDAMMNPTFAFTEEGKSVQGFSSAGWRQRAALPAVGLASVLAITTAWGFTRGTSGEALGTSGVVRASIALPDSVQLGFEAGSPPSLTISRDGLAIAFEGRNVGAASTSQVYVRRMNDARAIPLAGTAGGSSPFFSPDGKWIAFVSGGAIRKAPSGGGAASTVAPDVSNFWGGTWLPNGQIIYSSPGPDGSMLFSVAEGGGEGVRRTRTPRLDVDHSFPQPFDENRL